MVDAASQSFDINKEPSESMSGTAAAPVVGRSQRSCLVLGALAMVVVGAVVINTASGYHFTAPASPTKDHFHMNPTPQTTKDEKVAAPEYIGGFTACAYRCDPAWEGLDTGICRHGGCPSPDSSEVQDDLCWGLPYNPGPGDILMHDQVPFETLDACNAYLDSWDASAAFENKNSFVQRGNIMKTPLDLVKECEQCQNSWKGLTGKDIRDCINECIAAEGEEQIEYWLCRGASKYYGASDGLAKYYCDAPLHFVLQPLNKYLHKNCDKKVIEGLERIEDGVAKTARKMACWFHFLCDPADAGFVV